VALRPGVSDERLTALEAQHNLRLPADFREYLSRCDGFEGWGGSHGNDQRGLIDFGPLSSMEILSTEVPKLPQSDLDFRAAYLSFADYLISSHFYAIRLSDDGSL